MNKTFLRKIIEEAAKIKTDFPEIDYKRCIELAKKFIKEEEELQSGNNI